MSTDRHPLHDALAEAERAGAAYEVPVELVRAGVRRRRRVRAGVRGGAALAAVAAVAVVVPGALGGWSDGAPAAQGDWPASFGRCGKAVESVDRGFPVVADVTLRDGTISADRLALVTTRLRGTEAGLERATLSAAEVSLVRDGVVVGVDTDLPVQVGPPDLLAPAPEQQGADWSYVTVLASCAQYPDGRGDSRVPAGDYDLAVVQTVDWVSGDGTTGTARVATWLPVTVTDDQPAVEVDPTACLADTSALAALAGPQGDPFPVVVDADVPDVVAAGEPLRLAITATHEGTTDLDVRASTVSVVVSQDGQVLATPFEWDSLTDGGMRLAAGATVPLGATNELLDCTTRGLSAVPQGEQALPLPSGTYDVWVVLDLYLAPPTGTDEDLDHHRVVGGPWPLAVR